MDFFEVIQARRSIRHFKPDPVAAGLVDRVLEAGLLAPTAGNRQPWEYVVIEHEAALKQSVINTTFRGNMWVNSRPQDWIGEAPVVIVVCADVQRCISRYGWLQAHELVLEDISAAVENMLLAAVALGLASCWVGGFDHVALARCLNLPELIEPLAILPLGYAGHSPTSPAKRTLAEAIRTRV